MRVCKITGPQKISRSIRKVEGFKSLKKLSLMANVQNSFRKNRNLSQFFKKCLRSFGFIIVLIPLIILSGCAFTFGNVRALPGSYKKVTVPVFKNLTHETSIENFFTDAMIREIERTDTAKVVSGRHSDVTLYGIIQDIQFVSGGTQTQGLPIGTALNLAYRVLVRIELRLQKNEGGQVVWQSQFVGEKSYNAPRVFDESLNSANALYNQSSRTETINLIASDIMLEAFNQMTENF